MKKMPTIFIRDENNRSIVTDQKHPDCDWVFNGEGVATQKYDGTCCLIKDGAFYKRRMVRIGKKPPPGFIMVDADLVTGKRFGWVPVDPDAKEDRYHMEGLRRLREDALDSADMEGTYELVGPKIQGNAEGFSSHYLQKHSLAMRFNFVPTDFEGLKSWLLRNKDIEGLVWHHPDGRMAKIKLSDFGIKREES